MFAKTLMIVEDSPDDEALIRRALRKHGISCGMIVAHSGPEAVEYLCGGPGRSPLRPLPDLVLLDLKMQGMDGIDVLRRLRADARLKDLAVVIFTSSDRPEDLQNSLAAGATAYASKPVSCNEFTAAVRTLAERWMGVEGTPLLAAARPVLGSTMSHLPLPTPPA